MLDVLPKQHKDNSFDLVVRPSLGRAILVKGSAPSTSVTGASEILAAIDTGKATHMMTVFNLTMQLSAQHADQKAELSAQRYAQFIGLIDRGARWREQGSIIRAQRIADQAMVRISRIPTG
jgi:hypothetical protein